MKSSKKVATKSKPSGKSKPSDPIPPGGMVRSGGKLVPRFLRDTKGGDPMPRKGYVDRGAGLEVVPDEPFPPIRDYKKGGKVR